MAKDGIARKIGDRNRDRPNKMAVVTAVSPVLPPSDTPEALSTKVVVVMYQELHRQLLQLHLQEVRP